MLFVAKKVLRLSYGFATVRGKANKPHTNTQDQFGMEKDVFKAYRKQVQKGSILRQFREEVFRKSQLKDDWEVQSSNKKRQVNELEKMLSVDKDTILSNATQIQARAIKNRNIFDENSEKSLLSSYGNYKPYDKVHPVIKDRNLVQGQFLEDSHLTQNLYKFIDKISDDYEEKESIKQIMSKLPANKQGMTLTQYGKQFQKKMNDAQRQALNKYQDFKVHHQQKFTQKEIPQSQRTGIRRNWFKVDESITYDYTGIQKTVDPYTGGDNLQATLSPKAVDTIYDLYLQGWNVRDISKRFGILPARTKFCVWVRAQLYHQVIPKLGIKYYLRGLRFEQKYNQYQKFCDYGLDLDELSNNSILEEITQWNGQMLDAQRGEEKYQGAMMRLQRQRKFDRYVMLEVGRIGKENGRYKLKEWNIFRGKGSDQYFLRNQLLNPLTRAQKKFNKVYY